MTGGRWRDRFQEAWDAFNTRAGTDTNAREFADALQWPESTFSEIRNADEPPSHERVLALARVSGLHAGYLAYGEFATESMVLPPVLSHIEQAARLLRSQLTTASAPVADEPEPFATPKPGYRKTGVRPKRKGERVTGRKKPRTEERGA